MYDKEAVSIDVGGRLRELREERELSMRALARMSGLSANALSMIERAKSSPSVSTLYKLAEAMEVPITSFFRTEIHKNKVVFVKANERAGFLSSWALGGARRGSVFRSRRAVHAHARKWSQQRTLSHGAFGSRICVLSERAIGISG